LTGPTVTVEGDGFVEGEVNDLKAEGSVCNVSGDQTFNTITYTTTEKFIPGNYVIAIEEGVLQILEREVTVTLTGNSDSKPYNGELQSVYGYTVDISDPLYTEQDFEYYDVAVTGGVLVGEYPMVILAEQCLNNNANFIVTFVAVNGKMTIKPNNSVVVKITGRDETVVYDGTTHTFDVYDVEINDPVYTIDDFEFNGNGAASGKDAGSYAMTMAPEDFTNTNANFGTVTFEIVNGTLTVEPKEVSIEWSEDREYPYDGKEHKPEAWVGNLAEGDSCEVTVVGGQTEIGDDYVASVDSLSNPNYKLTGTAEIPFEIYGCVVIFADDLGNELLVKTVPYGDTPVYDGDEPTKRSYYEEYHYEFTGWTPEFVPVAERYTTYTAQFKEVANEFTITWVDGKGNVLKTEKLPYGATPEYSGETPTTNEREGFVYTFTGEWYPNVSMVVEDVTYTAQFDEKPAKVYYLESGDGSEHEKESGAKLRFVFSSNYDSETFSHFAGAFMDGQAIPASGYTATEGSLILDLKADYLDKLSIGDHTVSVAFDDYETKVEALFTVVEKKTEPTPEPPTPTPEEPTPEPPTPTPEEPTPTPEEPTPVPPTPTPTVKPDDDPKPRTGDTMNMAILAALLGAALATMLFVFMKRRERTEEED
jgi:LPXTG-motif cell wall-anchored protein